MRLREIRDHLQIADNEFSLTMYAKYKQRFSLGFFGGADVPSVGCPM